MKRNGTKEVLIVLSVTPYLFSLLLELADACAIAPGTTERTRVERYAHEIIESFAVERSGKR